MTVLLNIYTVT